MLGQPEEGRGGRRCVEEVWVGRQRNGPGKVTKYIAKQKTSDSEKAGDKKNKEEETK